MRIKKMAIVIFCIVIVSCLPFAQYLFIGTRIVPQIQEWYIDYALNNVCHNAGYVSYICLAILFITLAFLIIKDHLKNEMSKLVSEKVYDISSDKISIMMRIIKSGFYSSYLYIKRKK